jgi:hypothetical protein
MGRLSLIIFLGIVSGFGLALVCWAILFLLRPLLDELRSFVHSPRTARRTPTLTALAQHSNLWLTGVDVSPEAMTLQKGMLKQVFQLRLQDSLSEHWKSSVQVTRGVSDASTIIDVYQDAYQKALEESWDEAKLRVTLRAWKVGDKQELLAHEDLHPMNCLYVPFHRHNVFPVRTIMPTFGKRPGKSHIIFRSRSAGTGIEKQKRTLEELMRKTQAPLESAPENFTSQIRESFGPTSLVPARSR